MNNKRFVVNVWVIAIGVLAAAGLAQAGSNDGSITGRLKAADTSVVSGAEITARDPATGFTRKVKADADGAYRLPFLPVGTYTLEASKDGKSLGTLENVTVNLGVATTADMDLGGESLAVITVVASRVQNAIDVSSTETATNITREELDRLPVERDLTSVAQLAPGLTRGDSAFGGVSFGGSSVAENSVYINGLNVTDFYNRVGYSSVPYAFYKEFQIKTGGYSVEFGRTTGGVINAVTRAGTNEFDFGTEVVWEPSFAQGKGGNYYSPDSTDADSLPQSYRIYQYDEYDRANATVYASGPIIKDKLFFFALYEARRYEPVNTDNPGTNFFEGLSDEGFWGAKIDWQISDKHLLELLAFSDENRTLSDGYRFDLPTGARGAYTGTTYSDSGGLNWAATYTGYLAEGLSMKVLYGENERDAATGSPADTDCNRILDARGTSTNIGCTNTTQVLTRTDTREAARIDFEWVLGDHQLRFGLDRETNTSDHIQFYPGSDRLLYEIFRVGASGATVNGVPLPAGTEYVRTRQNEVFGSFETINSAYYLEDNWSITDNFVLNAGLRMEAFDNKTAEGDSYIKIDDMLAPRLGFSWDMKGDGRMKLFGNAGRYFLPVANVINIKQAGAFLDERTFYRLAGFESYEYNGQTYQRPILGAQFGPVDNSQGDGTVGDFRGEVDRDMDPVYQDELILGFQQMIGDSWSYGVRGIYRNLHNAIDDMRILSTGVVCNGRPNRAGFVMGNPGDPLTIFTDTDCNGPGGAQGDNDGWVTVDLATNGWAYFSSPNGGGTYMGTITGFPEPERTYKALELVVDRAWDSKWSLNASYTLAYSEGNAEGPVNSDFNFGDSGRTEAFDDPWVQIGGNGYLPNDHRHAFKLRGSYGIGESWRIGTSMSAISGRPISAQGVGNPFDGHSFHSFYVCTANCTAPVGQRVYEFNPRGSEGRTPWVYDVSANVTWQRSLGFADAQVRLTVYNLLNQQKSREAEDRYQRTIGGTTCGIPSECGAGQHHEFGLATTYQSPRYAQLTVKLDF
jgi:hypothetical protein